MQDNENKALIIDLGAIARLLWSKRKRFYLVWAITFVLASLWIFPQPRYYTCEVQLAPETAGEDMGGGLSSIASSFGFNLGGMGGVDAIYPELYPELFESPAFTVGLFDIQISTIDGKINTDYYTYIKNYQKQSPVTYPFRAASAWVKSLFAEREPELEGDAAGHNSFHLSKKEMDLMLQTQKNIACSVDKKTSVISISVKDQDPLVVATMADSVMMHLQNFIIKYRTEKSRLDVIYYQNLTDSALMEYEAALKEYGDYCDTHSNIIMQAAITERDRLETEMSIKLATYQATMTQLQTVKAKLQEKTPAFTTLKSSTVPVKPAGPKRMLFVIGMLFLATTIASIVFYVNSKHSNN